MLTHVVMFKLKEKTQELVDETVARLMAMDGEIPSLRGLEVGADVILSTRSYDVVLIADFDNQDGLDAYIAHPAHQVVLEFIERVMEPRIVVDFVRLEEVGG